MAATTLAQIREGLRVALDAIPNVHAFGYRPDTVTPPCVFVRGPAETDYHQTMVNGVDRWQMTVMALVGTANTTGAQKLLDSFIGGGDTKSVKQAIEADRTLGGIVAQATVLRCSGYAEYELKGVVYLGATFDVDIYAPGT